MRDLGICLWRIAESSACRSRDDLGCHGTEARQILMHVGPQPKVDLGTGTRRVVLSVLSAGEKKDSSPSSR